MEKISYREVKKMQELRETRKKHKNKGVKREGN